MATKQLVVKLGKWSCALTRHYEYERIYWLWPLYIGLGGWSPFCWRMKRGQRIVAPKPLGKQGQARTIYNWTPGRRKR